MTDASGREPAPPSPALAKLPEPRGRLAVDLRSLVTEATGIGVATWEVLRRLLAAGAWEVLGLAHRPLEGDHGLAEAAAAGGVALDFEHQSAPLGVLWQQLRLPRRLDRGDVDLLWSPLQTLPGRSPVPAVVTVHDLTVLLMPDTHRFKVRWSQLPFLSASLQQARRVVAVSEATAEDLRFHFPQAFTGPEGKDRLQVVPNGVSEEFRPASPEEVAAIREELGAPEGYVLYAGTLEPRKNVGALVTAWEVLVRERPEKTPPLVLAGGYGWRSRKLVERLEAVAARQEAEGGPALHTLGRVSQERLVRLYQGASVFAFPSFYEGFGLPILEAMACGVPVVTSDRSSLPEVLGGAGFTVRPEAPGELAFALQKILDEPSVARELGERGLRRAEQYSWARSASEMDRVLGEALGDL